MKFRTSQSSPSAESGAVPSGPALDIEAGEAEPAGRRPRLPAGRRRPAILLATAAAGAVLVTVLADGQPPAGTGTASAPTSVAEQLGISAETAGADAAASTDDLAFLQGLAASRSEREAEQARAAAAQAVADQTELDRQAAEQAAAAAAASTPAAPAPSGSFKDYALAKVGTAEQFGCLENLWGKESGWDPNAQNPTSSAYGIAQFLDSTWASTGIAKTSDGYRQIDAGLIYIEDRYDTPCAAWSHSQSNNWY